MAKKRSRVPTCLLLAVVAVVVVGDCGSGSKVEPRGHWGGLTLDLTLTDRGGAVVMCCGTQVTLDEPMVLDTGGRFDVTGTVTASAAFQVGQPMRYFGSVSGSSMTLSIETLIPAFGGNPAYWFPVPGPESTDFHFSLRQGVTGTFQHPDGTGACICENPLDPPGHH
jgi:hypothetical protein